MAGVMTLERFVDLLEPYLYDVYEVEVEKAEDYVSKIFTTGTSNKAKEPVTGIGAADLPKKWAGQVAYSDVSSLWNKDFLPQKYSSGLRFERELWDWAQWPEVKNRTNSVLISLSVFRQQHAHALFNAAFTGTVNISDEAVSLLGPDGQYLCDTDHPLSPESSDAQNNKLVLPLNYDNLEEARQVMFGFTDDKGKKLLRVPDTLVVGPKLDRDARELVYSVGRPDTADRADNVRKGAYNVLTLPLLESNTAWFLVDSRRMKQYCLWLDWRKGVPERESDFDTEVLKYKVVETFGYGFTHWSWIIGSTGTGS